MTIESSGWKQHVSVGDLENISVEELENISMYYIFPLLNSSRHCLSSPIFVLWLLKEDLQIWALNLPSIFRYLFPRAANLGGFVKSDFQPTWSRVGEHNKRLSSGMMMMRMKMKYSSKNGHPSSLVSAMPHEIIFLRFFTKTKSEQLIAGPFQDYFFQFQLPFRSKTISNILRILTN